MKSNNSLSTANNMNTSIPTPGAAWSVDVPASQVSVLTEADTNVGASLRGHWAPAARVRRALAALGLLAITAPAFAAGLINGDWNTGDETGWTRWRAVWSSDVNWAVTSNGPTPPEGTATLPDHGSFGWYQIIAIPFCQYVRVDADWAGDIGGASWAEVMLFSVSPGTPLADVVNRIDTGNAADVAYKKDSWGMNPPTQWAWQAASLSPHPAGSQGVVHSLGWIVVALKYGGFVVDPKWASWDNVTVYVVGAPVITTQPQSQTVSVGQSATFTVDAWGAPPLSYQWRFNGTDRPGATTSVLTIPSAQVSDQGSYSVVVTNLLGSATSGDAVLTVNVVGAPVITTQPQSQTVSVGQSATFTVDASGTPPLSYQWRFNGTDRPGATTSVLTIPSAQVSDQGSYSVVVANLGGSATSDDAVLTVLTVPSIEVTPLTCNFGDVELPGSATAIVTVANRGTADLHILSLALASGSSPYFTVTSAPEVPITLAPNQTCQVVLGFEPGNLGAAAGSLVIESDDPVNGTVSVALSGTGVPSSAPPPVQLATTLEFIAASVADGSLAGTGPAGAGDAHVQALMNQIQAALNQANKGHVQSACDQLQGVLGRTGRQSRPAGLRYRPGRRGAEAADRSHHGFAGLPVAEAPVQAVAG